MLQYTADGLKAMNDETDDSFVFGSNTYFKAYQADGAAQLTGTIVVKYIDNSTEEFTVVFVFDAFAA